MKKAVTIFLMVLYVLAATGTTIRVHYCMNRLIGWSLFLGGPTLCSNCGMAKQQSHGCCRDEQKMVQTTIHKQLITPVYVVSVFSIAQVANSIFYGHYINSTTNPIPVTSNVPPGWPDKDRCTLYCSFRI